MGDPIRRIVQCRLRDELLAREHFGTLFEAKLLIERWRRLCNTVRPHSLVGGRPSCTGGAPAAGRWLYGHVLIWFGIFQSGYRPAWPMHLELGDGLVAQPKVHGAGMLGPHGVPCDAVL